MKKTLFLTILSSSLAFAGDDVLTIDDLSMEKIQAIMANERFDETIYLKKGDMLPVTLRASGDVFSILGGELTHTLQVHTSFYCKFDEKEGPIFSLDQEEWKNMQEFFTGTISVGLGANEKKPMLFLTMDQNLRK